jgi:Ankyrin repeats (many copies)
MPKVWNAVNDGNLDSLKLAIAENQPIDERGLNYGGWEETTPLQWLIWRIYWLYHGRSGELTQDMTMRYDLYFQMLEILLENGANIEVTNRLKETPLLTLAKNGTSIQRPRKMHMITRLIDSGANVLASNQDGYSALHEAAMNGWSELTELLILSGANVRAGCNAGSTPLHVTAKFDHIDVARILVANGADVLATTDNGHTPADFARFEWNGHLEIADYLDNVVVEQAANRRAMTDALAIGFDTPHVPGHRRLLPVEEELMRMVMAHYYKS